jgi:rhodanese-related sulfurtransferase
MTKTIEHRCAMISFRQKFRRVATRRSRFIIHGTVTAPVSIPILLNVITTRERNIMRKNKLLAAFLLSMTTALPAAIALSAVLSSPASFAQNAASARPANAYKWKTPKLNRAQIDDLLAKPDKLLIIDVRRPDEVEKIGGFPVYFSIQTPDLEKELAYIPKDRNIVTVSNHAGRAGQIADLLSGKGFRVVGAIGVQNYEEEGGRINKTRSYYEQPPTRN